MRFAYADPPYLGCGRRYVDSHPDALIWDDPGDIFDDLFPGTGGVMESWDAFVRQAKLWQP